MPPICKSINLDELPEAVLVTFNFIAVGEPVVFHVCAKLSIDPDSDPEPDRDVSKISNFADGDELFIPTLVPLV